MLDRAAGEWGVEMARSYVVGDRPSDIESGRQAGAATVLVETGKSIDPSVTRADLVVADAAAAVDYILAQDA